MKIPPIAVPAPAHPGGAGGKPDNSTLVAAAVTLVITLSVGLMTSWETGVQAGAMVAAFFTPPPHRRS